MFLYRVSTYMQSLFGPADELPNASLSAGTGKKGEGGTCAQSYMRCDGHSDFIIIHVPTAGKDGLESGEDGHDGNEANPYPETEIDDMRAVRDAALARYIQVSRRFYIYCA